MKPTGAYIGELLKDDVYSIAVTTYEGEEGWANGQMRGAIQPAAAGSFESRLHALGKPCVFLDFRAVDGIPKHPMHAPQSLRISVTPPAGSQHMVRVIQTPDGEKRWEEEVRQPPKMTLKAQKATITPSPDGGIIVEFDSGTIEHY
jgi:hypothetical protein